MDAKNALEKLKAGNQRYIKREAVHFHQSKRRMEAIATGQHPFAIILGSANFLRLPEIIFDQGLGDLICVSVNNTILSVARSKFLPKNKPQIL